MIFIACKPFLCEGSIYIGGLETLLQKQQKATAKFERTDGIVGGKEKADGIYGPPCPTLLSHKTKPFLQMKFLEIENECKAKV